MHRRAQILSAQKAAGSFAVEVGKQIEEIGWVLDEAGNSRFVSVMPTVWVFGRDSHHAREMAARAKRLWESEPLPWMVQEESYLNPILLTASLRSEEHTSELQSLMRISYAVFCLKKKKTYTT